MRKTYLIPILLLAVSLLAFGLLFSGLSDSGDHFFAAPKNVATNNPAAEEYRFVAVPCWFDAPWREDIRCGELHTPASSDVFVLPVVRILDSSPEHHPDPVIYLQGGPGGSARLDSEGIESWLNWLRYANLGRDFILMDPRGVGRSRPALTCQAYDQYSLQVLHQNIPMQQELIEGGAIVKQCFNDLALKGFKPEQYGTEKSAQDLRALMTLLAEQNPHYQHWNLLGVSYGTRLAITAAKDFPSVRSLVLDSVYPAGYGGLQTWPNLFDQSLNRFFSWCAMDDSCKPVNGEPLLERLLLALERLREQPIDLTIARWDGEAPVTLVLNDHRFLSAVFSAIYSQHDWVHIASAVEAAINGERAGLQVLVESFINNALANSFSGLAFMAVDCMDNPIQPHSEYQQNVAQYPQFTPYMRELWEYQACHFLAVEGNQGLQREMLPTAPALLLAGELDPITPVEWAEALHLQWPGSQLTTLENIGHAVINSDVCVHKNLRLFLDAPEELFVVCSIGPE
jgi:pimeloyl-ACP methyl ester carboxylesterase